MGRGYSTVQYDCPMLASPYDVHTKGDRLFDETLEGHPRDARRLPHLHAAEDIARLSPVVRVDVAEDCNEWCPSCGGRTWVSYLDNLVLEF